MSFPWVAQNNAPISYRQIGAQMMPASYCRCHQRAWVGEKRKPLSLNVQTKFSLYHFVLICIIMFLSEISFPWVVQNNAPISYRQMGAQMMPASYCWCHQRAWVGGKEECFPAQAPSPELSRTTHLYRTMDRRMDEPPESICLSASTPSEDMCGESRRGHRIWR